jgi:hypothetical protein
MNTQDNQDDGFLSELTASAVALFSEEELVAVITDIMGVVPPPSLQRSIYDATPAELDALIAGLTKQFLE